MSYMSEQYDSVQEAMRLKLKPLVRMMASDLVFIVVFYALAVWVGSMSQGLLAKLIAATSGGLTEEAIAAQAGTIMDVYVSLFLTLLVTVLAVWLAYSITRIFIWNAVTGRKTEKKDFIRFPVVALLAGLLSLIVTGSISWVATKQHQETGVVSLPIVILLNVVLILVMHYVSGVMYHTSKSRRIFPPFALSFRTGILKIHKYLAIYVLSGVVLFIISYLGTHIRNLSVWIGAPFTMLLTFALAAYYRNGFAAVQRSLEKKPENKSKNRKKR